jgi:hypothetical protein
MAVVAWLTQAIVPFEREAASRTVKAGMRRLSASMIERPAPTTSSAWFKARIAGG